MGALQAAIEAAGLNTTLAANYPLANTRSLPDYGHPDNIANATRMEQPLDPDDSGLNPKLAGSAGDFGRRFVITSFRWLAPGEI